MMLPLPEPILLNDPPCHAVRFVPEGATARVVLVPGILEEGRCAHRAMHACARGLARAGAAVVQVEPYATGNSAGRLSEARLARWLDDVRAAAGALAGAGPLALLGCRAGALLAAAVAEELGVDRLVLLQPVTRGKEYLRQTRTRRAIQDKLTGEATPVAPLEVEGQILSAELQADLEAAALPETRPVDDTRLIQCSFNEKPLKEYDDLRARWGLASVRALVQEPFWLPHSPGAYAALVAAAVEEVLG